MPALITIDQFRAELMAKRTPRSGVFRLATDPPVPVEGAARTLRFCFSDESVDRMGDTIAAAGWDLGDFRRNPVALWAHDSSAPPIGGASSVSVEGTRLMGDIEFATPETYAFADTIYRLVLDKFIRAVSVGFMPTRYAFVDNDPNRNWGIDFLEQNLLEISVCPVPANPNALAEARSKGIDTRPLIEWAERTLDGGGRVFLTRTELERLRKAAKEPENMKTRTPGQRTRAPGGANEDDPTAGGAIVGDCGRPKSETCGMKDPQECSVHASAKADPVDPDDEKALRRALRRLLGPKYREEGDDDKPNGDEPPVAHEDAIRLAHKSLRTSKAFLTEAVTHHAKAMSLLDGVVDALDDDSGDGDGDTGQTPKPGDEEPESKDAQLARAAARKSKLAA